MRVAGSSPRVRGKHGYRGTWRDAGRIIPACAGQTGTSNNWYWLRSDHPRVCGANGLPSMALGSSVGSSPRVRGKQLVGGDGAVRDRIIPACAGQTATTATSSPSSQDHPRVCGANMGGAPGAISVRGSSPRVRGKPSVRPLMSAQMRIIPACAGQTPPAASGRNATTDHPRVCGANPTAPAAFDRMLGSSPRVRGKPCRSSRRTR